MELVSTARVVAEDIEPAKTDVALVSMVSPSQTQTVSRLVWMALVVCVWLPGERGERGTYVHHCDPSPPRRWHVRQRRAYAIAIAARASIGYTVIG